MPRVLPRPAELASALDARLVGIIRPLQLRSTSTGLSRTAASTLARLRDGGPQKITALASAEAVTQPSMTTLVTRLEQRGLAERRPDPADRRCVNVAITGEGRAVLGRMQAERARVLSERLAALGPKELAALAAALPALERLAAEPEAGR